MELSEETKKCPYCAETIKAQAIVCRYCKRELNSSAVSNISAPLKEHRTNRSPIIYIIVAFATLWGISQICGTISLGSLQTTTSNNSNSRFESSFPSFNTITLTGRGDDTVNINKPKGPAIAQISTTATSGNFIVSNYNEDGESLDLLVNEIGSYSGTRAIDLLEPEKTTRFEVNASGSWTIKISPLTSARKVSVPGTISGKGDDVILLRGARPDTAKINHRGESNFIVVAYDNRNQDLLVNEIGSYSGQVILGNATLLEIIADGSWSVEILSR